MPKSRIQLASGRMRRATAVLGLVLAALAVAWGGPVARFVVFLAVGALGPVFVRGITWPEYLTILAIAFVLAFQTLPPAPLPTTGRHRPPAPAEGGAIHDIRQP